MTTNRLIFSPERKYRIGRHLLVWGLFFVFSFYTNIEFQKIHELKMPVTYEISGLRLLYFLPMYVLIVYMFGYVLVPKFILTKKYILFMVAGAGIILFCFAVNIFAGNALLHFSDPDFPAEKIPVWNFLLDWNMTVQRGICVAGGATFIVLAKGWYLQQLENTRLAKQEAENRTWLLKSQIQPEFLFHSLQSLHRKINSSSDDASKMILHLSDLFSYILYDCNENYILLENELIAVQHLVTAEKMNEESKTDITLDINGNCDGKYIIPLTLFSFLRNHMDQRSEERFIGVVIDIKNNILNLVVNLKNRMADYNTEMNAKSGRYDNLPENFIDYKVHNGIQEHNYTITASLELMDNISAGNIKYDLSAVN